MYKPGTLVTLKDGNVYRTSKKCIDVCNKCRSFYGHFCKFAPCSGLNKIPIFSSHSSFRNREECGHLYGGYQFPKLVTLCGNQDKL